jgi:hypothetical protein
MGLASEVEMIGTRSATMVLALAALLFAIHANAQWSGHDGWVEETNGKTLVDDPGHSYLDPASVHRGDDGLIYFNESNGVTKPEEVGHTGFMKDAYDCARNIKYMCVGTGDWRNDQSSAIHTSNDPALPIYRKYLCGDDTPAASATTKSETTSR